MDVHPPQHPIETKRDFFLHLFTITCGLLIALSLEALVEWGHHRALVREARENIRRELEDNKKAAVEDIKNIDQDRQRFDHNVEQERAMFANRKGSFSLNSTLNWDTQSDAAWRTARDTGALAYMPYAEVQRYADVYRTQEVVNTRVVQLLYQHGELLADIPAEKNAPPEAKAESDRLLHDTALIASDLGVFSQVLAQLRDQYTSVLAAN